MIEITYKGKFLVIKDGKKEHLVIGDLHLGFESALNQAGIFVNRYVFEETVKDIEEILSSRKKFDEIILLGDVKHTFGSILREERDQLKKIIALLESKTKKIVITKGNHDALLKYIDRDPKIKIEDMHIVKDIALLHGDKDNGVMHNKAIKTVIIGHLHPAITLREGVKAEKYKCFLDGEYKGKRFVIVPSLSNNNEGTDPRDFTSKLPWELPLDKFKVIIVGNNLENFEFGRLKDIK